MNMIPQYQRVALDAANTGKELAVTGHSLFIINSGNPADRVNLYLQQKQGTPIPIGRGFGLVHVPYTRIVLEWEAQSGGFLDIVTAGDPLEADFKLAQIIPLRTSDSVEVTNFPASFNVGNFPTTQPVSLAAAIDANTVAKRWAIPTTPVCLKGYSNGSAVQLTNINGGAAYAVAASSKLVIHRAQVIGYGQTTTGRLEIRDSVGTVKATICSMDQNGPTRAWEGLEVPTGHKLYVVSDSAYGVTAQVMGWEEAA